jgi:hypothetical protein
MKNFSMNGQGYWGRALQYHDLEYPAISCFLNLRSPSKGLNHKLHRQRSYANILVGRRSLFKLKTSMGAIVSGNGRGTTCYKPSGTVSLRSREYPMPFKAFRIHNFSNCEYWLQESCMAMSDTLVIKWRIKHLVSSGWHDQPWWRSVGVSSTSLGIPLRMHRTATLTTKGSEEILCRKRKVSQPFDERWGSYQKWESNSRIAYEMKLGFNNARRTGRNLSYKKLWCMYLQIKTTNGPVLSYPVKRKI